VYVWQEEKSIRDFWLEATLLHETTRKHLGVNAVVMQVYRGGYFAMEFFTAKKERTLLNCRQEQQEVCEV